MTFFKNKKLMRELKHPICPSLISLFCIFLILEELFTFYNILDVYIEIHTSDHHYVFEI